MSDWPAHAIVSNLIRALTHKIRTPLSVISNELEAFKAVLPAAELDLARQRVTQISDVLKTLSQFAVSPTPKQRLDAQEIVRELSAVHAAAMLLGESCPALPLQGDRRLFSLALSSLAGLLSRLSSESDKSKAQFLVESRARKSQGQIVFRSPIKTVLENSELTWTSLSEFFNHGMDLDSYLPPCIDSILIAHGVNVSIAARAGIEITLQIPLCD